MMLRQLWIDLRVRLAALFGRQRLYERTDEEVQTHLAMLEQRLVESGLPRDVARIRARQAFGNPSVVKEQTVDSWRYAFMATLIQDVRYGLRAMWNNPGFTVVAVLTLALGIGANTAIFSLVNAVLLNALPFPDPDRLAIIYEEQSWAGFPHATPAPANYADWRAQNHVFDDVAAMILPTSFNLLGGGEPQRVYGVKTTGNLFAVLGIGSGAGRLLTESDDRLDAPAVAVISDRLWRGSFSASPAIVGQTVRVDGIPRIIVGVAPAGFHFPDNRIDVWIPAQFPASELAVRTSHYLSVVARLKGGVTFVRAQSDMSALAKRLEFQYPAENARVGAVVVPLREEFAGVIRPTLRILIATAGMVLLIACVNLANLLLARGSGRSRELALRTALGAGRFRVVRQLLTESALLAVLGACLGGALSFASVPFLSRLVPLSFPPETLTALNLPVLGFTAAVTLATIFAFGAGPAWMAAHTDLTEAMKQGAPGSAGLARGGMRNALVVGEMTLTVVLLIGAGLLLRSYAELRAVDTGFRADHILSVDTVLSSADYADPARREAFFNRVLNGVRALPGVSSAAYVNYPPLTMRGGSNGFFVEGRPAPKPGQVPEQAANNRTASPGYLETMGILLLRGRNFDERDSATAPRVAVINETMARTFWPGDDPVGRHFAFRGPEGPWTTIIGVAGDVHQMGIELPARAEMYLPLAQQRAGMNPFFWPQTLMVRSSGDPLQFAPAIRRIVTEAEPSQPVSNVRTMEDIVDAELLGRETRMTLVAFFAALALLLAAVGLYGVLAYLIAQRTPEIGIRMALGAQRGDVLFGILGRGLGLTIAGIALGLAASFGLTRLLASMLYGIAATDATTFIAVPIVLMAVASLASYIPARRATTIDPIISLRHE